MDIDIIIRVAAVGSGGGTMLGRIEPSSLPKTP